MATDQGQQQTQGNAALPPGSQVQADGQVVGKNHKPELVIERPAGVDPQHPHELVIVKRPQGK